MIKQNMALRFVDDLAADDLQYFSFEDALKRLNLTASATSNLLHRMVAHGLIDRIRRGRYAIRRFGVLGTRAASEDLATVVAAAFSGHQHRIAYRTALDEHDLLTHPVQTIYVATRKRMRVRSLSGRALCTIAEPEEALGIGSLAHGLSWISDLERTLLDVAARPLLCGGATILAGAVVAAGKRVDPDRLARYAKQLGWSAALRRIGSVSEALVVNGLAGRLAPLKPPVADLFLSPGAGQPTAWRDARWRVRWTETPEEIANTVRQ